MADPPESAAATEPTPGAAPLDHLREHIERCATEISLAFERWDDPTARGPGLYVVVLRGSTADFVTPMGANRWPVEDCRSVFDDPDGFLRVARIVASSRDGAIVVHADGTIEEAMVRITQLDPGDPRADDLQFAGWMGARHMSALETSTRPEVSAAITLSEEDGRVTVFTDGTYENAAVTASLTE